MPLAKNVEQGNALLLADYCKGSLQKTICSS
nr:MAG TPA: hypothetical protein [Caudoviricetes sp.]